MIRGVRRRGLSLLEVLLSLAILLLSLGALRYLMGMCTDQALLIQQKSEAARLAHSLLAQVAAGITPVSETVEEDPVEDDPSYTWSMSSEGGLVEGLYTVTIVVARDMGDGRRIEYRLSQMLIDPAMVGSNQDQSLIAGQLETDTSPQPAETDTGGM